MIVGNFLSNVMAISDPVCCIKAKINNNSNPIIRRFCY